MYVNYIIVYCNILAMVHIGRNGKIVDKFNNNIKCPKNMIPQFVIGKWIICTDDILYEFDENKRKIKAYESIRYGYCHSDDTNNINIDFVDELCKSKIVYGYHFNSTISISVRDFDYIAGKKKDYTPIILSYGNSRKYYIDNNDALVRTNYYIRQSDTTIDTDVALISPYNYNELIYKLTNGNLVVYNTMTGAKKQIELIDIQIIQIMSCYAIDDNGFAYEITFNKSEFSISLIEKFKEISFTKIVPYYDSTDLTTRILFYSEIDNVCMSPITSDTLAIQNCSFTKSNATTKSARKILTS